MKQWIATLLLAGLAGCGTIKTVTDEAEAVDDLARWESNCHSIPRAYSGVAYQFCNFDGPPRSGSHWSPGPILLDMAASAIADTLLIPYTGYQQFEHGNVPVRRLEY